MTHTPDPDWHARELARMERRIQKIMTVVRFGRELAALSCCKRAQRGAVIFPYDCSAVLAIGYNGPPALISNDACTAEEGKCGCVHAEANAIVKLSPQLCRQTKTLLWCTSSPCPHCAGLILNSMSVSAVLYDDEYRNSSGLQLLADAGLRTFKTSTLELPPPVIMYGGPPRCDSVDLAKCYAARNRLDLIGTER